METVAPGTVPKGLTRTQKAMALHMGLAVLWSLGLLSLFHRAEAAYFYLICVWTTSIIMFPVFPLPLWRHVASTLAPALLFAIVYSMFKPFG